MRVVLIGVFPYRDADGGASGRLRNLGLSLKAAGAVPVLWYAGGPVAGFDWQGVKVESFSGEKPGRGRVNAPAVAAMGRRLMELASAGEVDAVIFYNQDALYAMKLAWVCARAKVPFFQQYAEMHLPEDYANGWRNSYFLLEWLHLQVMPRFGAGSIVISRELESLVGRRGRHVPLVLPTVARVAAIGRRDVATPSRLVCISTGARRDDLPLLLRAYASARQGGANLKLQIMGLSGTARQALATLASELGTEDSVTLSGFVSEEEYAAVLASADAFVLLRSDDRSSRACYPSKLHELFGTGAPVILSAVGDLPRHFTHGHDCLMVPPGDLPALAGALRWPTEQREAAAEIGLRGNRRAREIFDVEGAGRSLLAYLQSRILRPRRS